MSVIQISKKAAPQPAFALFNLGFRPFFLVGSLFAALSILLWAALYFGGVTLPLAPLAPSQWHAHEMIYGYSLAIIAGFLLTAIMNWTGVQTVYGKPLAALVVMWLTARVLFAIGAPALPVAAVAEALFMMGLLVAVAHPVWKTRQWQQSGVLALVALLTIGNVLFYLGIFGIHPNGVFLGTHGGVYGVVAMILVIGGRVIPGFIRNGTNYRGDIPNPKWLNNTIITLFLLFAANQLFLQDSTAAKALPVTLATLTAVRLWQWHIRAIWHHPLLWGLYLAVVSIAVGFVFFAMTAFIGTSPFLGLHAFSYGGIGLATIAMMSRATLGHTGRSIRQPPKATRYALLLVATGTLTRVVAPLLDATHYGLWIAISQGLWVAAFAVFIASHAAMLLLRRVDGQAG